MNSHRTTHALSLALSLSFVVAPLAGCERANTPASRAPTSAGQPAPALTGVDADGQPIDLATLTGKTVIVDFWASWCEPCQEAMPGLDQLAADYGDRLVVIGVSVDEDPEDARAFVERVGVRFSIVHDEAHTIAAVWGPPKMPTTYVIDPAGVIVDVHDGYDAKTLTQLRAQIDGAIE